MSKINSKINKIISENPNPDYYVYTDGACSKNEFTGAKAGI